NDDAKTDGSADARSRGAAPTAQYQHEPPTPIDAFRLGRWGCKFFQSLPRPAFVGQFVSSRASVHGRVAKAASRTSSVACTGVERMSLNVAIVPAGQWGTALAVPFSRGGHSVRLYFRRRE